jgi:hypothetical protein
MAWILPSGKYYDTSNNVAIGAIEVDVRPSPLHDYVSGGVGNTVWAINTTRQAAETAEIAKNLADQAALTNAKANAVIQYLVSHTPAECSAKVATDVNNLATAVTMMQNFAIALSILAKDKLR